MNKPKKESFQVSFTRLQQILAELESDETLDVDEMVERIKEGAELLKFCRAKLKSATVEIEKVQLELDRVFEEGADSPTGS